MAHCRGVLQQAQRGWQQSHVVSNASGAILGHRPPFPPDSFALCRFHATCLRAPRAVALQGQNSCRIANIVKNMKQDFVVQKSFQMTEDTIRNDFSWYKKKPFQMTKDPILKRFKTVSSIKKNIKKKMWKQNRHQA